MTGGVTTLDTVGGGGQGGEAVAAGHPGGDGGAIDTVHVFILFIYL